MSEYRFTRYVMGGEKAEGILVHADTIKDAARKAVQTVYEDERPVTILLLDEDPRIAELQKQVDRLTTDKVTLTRTYNQLFDETQKLQSQVDALQKDVGFYKCCALSGEIPKEGSQPSAAIKGEDGECI